MRVTQVRLDSQSAAEISLKKQLEHIHVVDSVTAFSGKPTDGVYVWTSKDFMVP